ncbi:hypothetical protein Salat_1716300 [Sesamum alatum]|uniref:Uncharacterized protein n=1 Tax=Sesamum alatum TaxID=300844 RepID=A0AAE2CKF0_9LAMI|nr:hypothetical protein Salat_1716300 [Sesamum alatum]
MNQTQRCKVPPIVGRPFSRAEPKPLSKSAGRTPSVGPKPISRSTDQSPLSRRSLSVGAQVGACQQEHTPDPVSRAEAHQQEHKPKLVRRAAISKSTNQSPSVGSDPSTKAQAEARRPGSHQQEHNPESVSRSKFTGGSQ